VNQLAENKWQKAYRLNNLDKIRDAKRRWRAKNKDKANATQRAWRLKNKEKDAEYKAKYNAKYPYKNGEYVRARRARKLKSLVVPYTVEEVLRIYGTNCHLCLEQIDLNAERKPGRKGWQHGLQIDHIIPISRGGSDIIENVRPAHGVCNMSRGAKILGERNE